MRLLLTSDRAICGFVNFCGGGDITIESERARAPVAEIESSILPMTASSAPTSMKSSLADSMV